MQTIRSLIFWVSFIAWTAFITVPFCFLWVCPRRWLVKHLNWWARGVMWLLKVTVNVRYEILGREFMPKGPALVVSNHQSAWDTIIFHIICGGDPCFIMKRVLFWIPFYGQHAWKMGMIGIDRNKNGLSGWKRMLKAVPDRLRRGQSVIIFPEGTRMRPGECKPFQPGVFHIHHCALHRNRTLGNCPTVPVALDSGKCWPKAGWILQPGTIKLRFLPAVPRDLGQEEFLRQLEESVRTAQSRLD